MAAERAVKCRRTDDSQLRVPYGKYLLSTIRMMQTVWGCVHRRLVKSTRYQSEWKR